MLRFARRIHARMRAQSINLDRDACVGEDYRKPIAERAAELVVFAAAGIEGEGRGLMSP